MISEQNISDNTLQPSNPVLSPELEPYEPYRPVKGYSLLDIDDTDQPVEYIGGLFPKGKLSALVGESGKGKSWVLIAASLTITSNIPFLPTDNYTLKSTDKTLIIETEGRIKEYRKRIEELGGKVDNYLTPSHHSKILGFQNKEDIQLIENVINYDAIEYVIIDSFAGFSSVDENSYQVLPCLKWLCEIALKYNVAVTFTQLANKGEQKKGRLTNKSIRGFSGIHQFPELIWGLDVPKTSDDITKRLYQVKNNIEQKDVVDYVFKLDKSTITFTDEIIETQKNRMDKRREIRNLNMGKFPQEIAKLIQQVEPEAKLNSLTQWVINQA